METINVVVDKKFEQMLKEEAEEFSIDWSLVEIKWRSLRGIAINSLNASFGCKNMVKMVVLGFEGKIPVQDVDKWFRSYRFTYCIYYKTADTATEKMEMLSLGAEGTIRDIAKKTP